MIEEKVSCEVCQKLFNARSVSKPGRFCSVKCRNTNNARVSADFRADKMRGSGEGKGYRKRGGRHEHRLVAEEMLGRPLRKGEIVHHIDHNKLNNKPENLQVMSQSEHVMEHKPWEKRKVANHVVHI